MKTQDSNTPEAAFFLPHKTPEQRDKAVPQTHFPLPLLFYLLPTPKKKDVVDWNVFVAFSVEPSKHLEDRKDVSLTAFLWPIDSKISEESDNIQGGTVLCKFHLDIDFCEKPLERICL